MAVQSVLTTDRHDDERDERGDPSAHDRGEQNDDGGDTEQREHAGCSPRQVDHANRLFLSIDHPCLWISQT